MMSKTIVALLLVLHGLVHAILAAVPNPSAPDQGFANFFPGFGSWLLTRAGLSEPAGKTLAIVLAVAATLGFVAAGLALLGVLVPFDWWRALAIASAVVSLVLVVIFWDLYLIVGLLIDAVVLATLIFTNWSPG
jgi:hypothetical protein